MRDVSFSTNRTPDSARCCSDLRHASFLGLYKWPSRVSFALPQGLMASPSATARDHLRTLGLLCLILSYDLSWVVCAASMLHLRALSLGVLIL